VTGPQTKDGETMPLSMTPRRGVVALVTLGLLTAGTAAASPAVAAPLLGADCGLPAGAVVKDLYAVAGSMPVPGVPGDVPVWSYTSDGSTPTRAAGPTLTVAQNDIVVVKLHNNLGRPTTLAVPQLDGQLETGTDPSGAQCYAFTAARSGTFVYEADGSADAARQVAMGMVGALVVQSSDAGTAYGTGTGSDFAVDSVLLVSDVDPALNQSADPTSFDMRLYTPRASLINGRPYPATTPVSAAAGDRVLLRLVNAAIVPHSLGVLGLTEHVLGRSSRALAQPYDVAVETVSAGDTLDAIVTLPATGGPKYTVYDSSTRLDNNGQRESTSVYAQVKFGGALTFIDTGGSAPTPGGPTLSGLTTTPSRTNGTAAHPMSFSATVTGTATTAEYFFDDSTVAAGSGTSFAVSGTSISQAVDLPLLAALPSGSHTLFVRASNGTTWGPAATASFSVDKSGPVVGSLAASPAAVNGAAVSLSASATEVGGGIVAAGGFAVDGATPAGPLAVSPTGGAASVSMAGTISATDVQALTEGRHFVSATGTDDFGNTGAAGPTGGTLLLVDRQNPVTGTVTVTPSPNDGTQGISYDPNSVEVRAPYSDPLATDGSSSGVVSGEGFLDPVGTPAPGTGFPLTAYAGPQQELVGTFPLSELVGKTSGNHQVGVRAKDAAGNWGALSVGTLVINRSGPVLSNLAATAAATAVTATLTGTATGTAVNRVEFFVGADPGQGLATAATLASSGQPVTTFTGSLNLTGMALGSYTVNVRARNADGTWGVLQTTTLTLQPLFADGFEGANGSNPVPPWASRTQSNGGTAVISTTAPLAGTSSLLGTVGGTTNTARNNSTGYVTSPAWAGVSAFQVQFQLDRGSLVTGTAARWVTVMRATQGTTNRVQVQLSRAAAGNDGSLRMIVNRSGGTSTLTSSVPITAGTHTVRVEWSAGSSAAIRLLVDGTAVSATLNTNGFTVTGASVGLVATTGGTNTTSKSGSAAFDSFITSRYPLP
jgi:hypothetical protein